MIVQFLSLVSGEFCLSCLYQSSPKLLKWVSKQSDSSIRNPWCEIFRVLEELFNFSVVDFLAWMKLCEDFNPNYLTFRKLKMFRPTRWCSVSWFPRRSTTAQSLHWTALLPSSTSSSLGTASGWSTWSGVTPGGVSASGRSQTLRSAQPCSYRQANQEGKARYNVLSI